ncbi:hypothetical protein B0H13DRAFT_2301171 [Mycena leptocephala]|nr:hypothetical protein B0H13DRAFT_2301171 [Mycena leptocephala]
MTCVEKLISTSKHYTRAVHPFRNLGSVMLYGPEKHWGTPPETAASNEVTIPASELEWQEQGIAALDKLFSVAPELLEVGKLLYLEASYKLKQWDGLVSMMRTAATS